MRGPRFTKPIKPRCNPPEKPKAGCWIIRVAFPGVCRTSDGLAGSADTACQVRCALTVLYAVAYCEARNIAYEVVKPKQRKLRMKAYADNFAYTGWAAGINQQAGKWRLDSALAQD